MKYKEEKIASFQIEKRRWQLLKITNEIHEIHFQIRSNRKVLYNYKLEGPARQQFAYITKCELYQLKLFN